MEILENFGIEWTLTVAQIVNFLIIFYVLKKYLYRPIFSILKKRSDTIKEGLEKAEENRIELEKTLLKEKQIIKDAQDTAKKILVDTREQAHLLAKDIEEEARQQAERIVEEARLQIIQDTKIAEHQLNKHISKLSVAFLKKSLPGVFSHKNQTEIVTRAVRALGKKPK